MRKFSELRTSKKKARRIFYSFWNFLKYRLWGDYKLGGIRGAYHWVRCHVWNRYHIINISGIEDYKWGWIDRDVVLLYASFKILQDFVEKEDPTIGLRTAEDYRCSEDQYHIDTVTNQLIREKEIRFLYVWWTEDRPRNWKELNNCWSKPMLAYEREKELIDQDEQMLIRLAKIRTCLWT